MSDESDLRDARVLFDQINVHGSHLTAEEVEQFFKCTGEPLRKPLLPLQLPALLLNLTYLCRRTLQPR